MNIEQFLAHIHVAREAEDNSPTKITEPSKLMDHEPGQDLRSASEKKQSYSRERTKSGRRRNKSKNSRDMSSSFKRDRSSQKSEYGDDNTNKVNKAGMTYQKKKRSRNVQSNTIPIQNPQQMDIDPKDFNNSNLKIA